MISIEKADKYDSCNCCFSKEKVIHIIFQNRTGHGTAVALCDKCAKDLMIILKEKYGDLNDQFL